MKGMDRDISSSLDVINSLFFPFQSKKDIIDIPEVTRFLFSSIKAEDMYQISAQSLYNSKNLAISTSHCLR